MPDVQEVFRLATNKVDPDPDALERQVRRQRAESRKSRVRAYIAVAAVVIVAAIAGFALSRAIRSEPTPEGTGTPTPSVATDLTFLQALPAGATQPTTAIVDLRGKQTSTIGGVPLDAYAESVTPDGTQMAFIASPNEVADNQVGMMRTDGTGAHFVATPGIDVGWTVAVSPNGTRVAFEGTVDGNTDIWVVNSDGTGLLRLTHDPATDQYPAWSPDGTTIAYDNAGSHERLRDPQFSKTAEIFSVAADGGSITRLTQNSWFDAAPSYARDGKKIVDESWGGLSTMNTHGNQLPEGPSAHVDGLHTPLLARRHDDRVLLLRQGEPPDSPARPGVQRLGALSRRAGGPANGPGHEAPEHRHGDGPQRTAVDRRRSPAGHAGTDQGSVTLNVPRCREARSPRGAGLRP
jgi:TolB protein